MPLPSFQDLYDLAKAEILLRRPQVKAFAGSIADMVSAGAAAIGDRVLLHAADRFRATFLDGSRGDDLTNLVDDHQSLTRTPAIPAFGTASFTRSVANPVKVTIPPGTVLATERDSQGNELRFTTDAPVTWNASEGGAKSVGITAELGGLASNVAAAKVTRVVSTLTEAFTVTNSAACIGGDEEESDEELRERARLWWQTLRGGTAAAQEYGARTVPSVKFASAIEAASGMGTVYVCDAEGNSNATMVAQVVEALKSWRAMGSFIQVVGATPLVQNIAITLTLRSGVDVVDLVEPIQAAVAARVNKRKIGETLYQDQIMYAAKSVAPDDILNAVVTTPPGPDPVVPGAGAIIRCGTVAVVSA